MDPTNFVNATWSINSVKVFKKVLLSGTNAVPSSSISTLGLHLSALKRALLLAGAVAFIFANVL